MISFPNPCRHQRCLYLYIFQALFLSKLAASAEARTWYVKPDGTGDTPTIQAAIDSSQTSDEARPWNVREGLPSTGPTRTVDNCEDP